MLKLNQLPNIAICFNLYVRTTLCLKRQVVTVFFTPSVPRYLLELDCDGNPAWECISNMHKWMLRLLFNSKEEFQGIVHAREFNNVHFMVYTCVYFYLH